MDEGHTQAMSGDGDEVPSVMPYPTEPCGGMEISRSKRGPGLFVAFHVMVDGDDVGEVRRGQTRLFQIAAGRHEVHLELAWSGSPSIDVDIASGETVKLVCRSKFHFGQAKRALANPDECIVLERSADVGTAAEGTSDKAVGGLF
jgi:hypothetical protein